MLLPKQKQIVQATVPVLRQHGEEITKVFYQLLFEAHPSLMNTFNPANQRDGAQARSLAASILAYAAHIDHLEKLSGMVDMIAHKHVSLQVQPEHYPIVGQHLLEAIKVVLGDAATPEIIDAWAAAYGQLAQVMIGREESLYSEGASQPGGWRGYKPFTVLRKQAESETITSFYLAPADGQPLPDFAPGQYLGIRIHIPGSEFQQIRQYSLSHAPNAEFYRISVKRETSPQATNPNGQISNYLHDHINPGDRIEVSMPTGNFVLDPDKSNPIVLLSGGVGITPTIAMLQMLAQHNQRQVLFVHATPGRAQHAFLEEVRAIEKSSDKINSVIFYEKAGPTDIRGTHHDETGYITAEALRVNLPTGDADFYYCGPLGFMFAVERILDELNIPLERRYSETFAPDPSFAAVLANA